MTQTTDLRTATRDAEKIAYLEVGAGEPTIVFVHGWCCDHTYWRDQVPHFAKTNRVIAVDLPGHGASDKPDRDYTIPRFAEDISWLIQELDLDRPVVVGHSMGGITALHLAHNHPELVRGTILVDSTIAPLPETLRPIIDQALAAMKTPAYKEVAAGFVRMNLFNDKSPKDLVEETVAGMSATPQRVLATEIDSVLNLTHPTGQVPVPTLYLRAATMYTSADQLRANWPGMEVQEFACAHFVQMERPAETNTAIENFVEKVR